MYILVPGPQLHLGPGTTLFGTDNHRQRKPRHSALSRPTTTAPTWYTTAVPLRTALYRDEVVHTLDVQGRTAMVDRHADDAGQHRQTTTNNVVRWSTSIRESPKGVNYEQVLAIMAPVPYLQQSNWTSLYGFTPTKVPYLHCSHRWVHSVGHTVVRH